jgi:hypothetical protein
MSTRSEALKAAVLALLEEIKDLPNKVTDPNWLEAGRGGRRRASRFSRAADDTRGSQGPGRESEKFAARKRLRKCARRALEGLPSYSFANQAPLPT